MSTPEIVRELAAQLREDRELREAIAATPLDDPARLDLLAHLTYLRQRRTDAFAALSRLDALNAPAAIPAPLRLVRQECAA